MSYTVRFHHLVVSRDLARLSRSMQKRIVRAVESKLSLEPHLFGRALRSPLAPFRSLRVGDYRIVYLVKRAEIQIFAVGHRRNIYEIASEREDR